MTCVKTCNLEDEEEEEEGDSISWFDSDENDLELCAKQSELPSNKHFIFLAASAAF